MDSGQLSKQKRDLYILAMVNSGIWALSMIALAIVLHGSGNFKGMFVILAGGTAVSIQIVAALSRLE